MFYRTKACQNRMNCQIFLICQNYQTMLNCQTFQHYLNLQNYPYCLNHWIVLNYQNRLTCQNCLTCRIIPDCFQTLFFFQSASRYLWFLWLYPCCHCSVLIYWEYSMIFILRQDKLCEKSIQLKAFFYSLYCGIFWKLFCEMDFSFI